MDTSETYIDMCDCEEIQGRWKVKQFDMTEDGHVVVFPNEKEKIIESISEDGVGHCGATEDFIWLPRQDQIQEIILDATPDFDTSIRHETLICNFAYFCGARNEDAEGRSNVSIRKESLEVLWLAFYMYLIHKKCWGGEGWESWDKWENSQDYEYGLGLTPQN